MERWQAKLVALLGTFVLPLLATLLPYKLSDYVAKKGDVGKRVLSCLMCFGGGIFFGTYLLHMAPEVQLLLQNALVEPYNIQYPVQNLLTGLGFFLVLFSEKLVLKWNKRRIGRKQHRSVLEVIDVKEVRNGNVRCGSNAAAAADGELDGPWLRQADRSSPLVKGDSAPDGGACEDEACVVHTDSVVRLTDSHTIITGMELNKHETEAKDPEHQSHHHNTRSIILIVALSMHRIFEGMTIGLQSSVHNIWSLFLAVMCHELVIGFSLGLQLVKSRLALRRMSIASLICSAIMPVGVAVGIVLTELGREGSSLALANGVLQAVAMGTFIYVTFFEILQEELDPHDTSLGKIFFVFAGFVMMALLDLIPEEDGGLNARSSSEPASLLSDFTTSGAVTLSK